MDVHPLHAHDIKFNVDPLTPNQITFVWWTRKNVNFKIPKHVDYIKQNDSCSFKVGHRIKIRAKLLLSSILGFLRRNLAFAHRSTKEVAYKTLARPKLENAANGALTRNFRLIRLRKFRGQQPTGPAGDGETRVVSAKCLTSCNGYLLRPGGTSPPCFSFRRFIVEQCLLKKTSISPLLTV